MQPFLDADFLCQEGAKVSATPARQTCHAGMANVPRRRGRRAVPAWQIGNRHIRTISRHPIPANRLTNTSV